MKKLILETLILIVLFNVAESISMKNIQYVYRGLGELGLVNQKLIIECPITGNFYLWKFYQHQSEPQVLLEQEGKRLTIDSVTTERSGIYECKTTTGFVNTDRNITVKIIDPNSEIVREICSLSMSPKITELSKGLCFFNDKITRTIMSKTGEDAEFDCTAIGTDVKYFWNYIDESGMKIPMQLEFNISKLIFKSVTPDNQGTYRCEVTDKYGQRLSSVLKLTVKETSSDINMEITGDKYDDVIGSVGQEIKLKCEVKNTFDRIYSIKWGKRIKNPVSESISKKDIVSWDQFIYKLLSASEETSANPQHLSSTLTLSQLELDHSGIYTCLAMDSRGRTVHKLFNLTVSSALVASEQASKSYLLLLYILLPVILIFICICIIIYCCVKSSSTKSHTSLPLKKYATPNNATKEQTSNYYYQMSNNRPPLPQPNESQASLVTPNTLNSYSSYGNYHLQPTNQPSCCSSNGV